MNRETLRRQANVLRSKKNANRINATSVRDGIVRMNNTLPHDPKNLRPTSTLEASIETREVRRKRIAERIAKRSAAKSKKLAAQQESASQPKGVKSRKGCGKCRRKLGG